MTAGPLVLLAVGSFVVPALLAWVLARRQGIGVLWAALIVGAVLAVVGWAVTRQPEFGDAAIARSIRIYFVLLPGFVGLVTGAAIGLMSARR